MDQRNRPRGLAKFCTRWRMVSETVAPDLLAVTLAVSIVASQLASSVSTHSVASLGAGTGLAAFLYRLRSRQ